MSIFTAPTSSNRAGTFDTTGFGVVNDAIYSSGSGTYSSITMPAGALIIVIVTSTNSDEAPYLYDDIGNVYLYGGTSGSNGNGLTQYLFYCLSNAVTCINTVSATGSGGEDFFSIYVAVVPISGGYATFDTFASGGLATHGTTATTAPYTTTGTDECVLTVCASETTSTSSSFYTAGSGWTSESRNYGTTTNSALGVSGVDVVVGALTSGTFQAGETVIQTSTGATALVGGNSGTVSPYGLLLSANTSYVSTLTGPALTTTIGSGSHAGTGYAVGDTGYIAAGNNNATYRVTAIGTGGKVSTLTITNQGSGYTTGNNQTTATGGAQPGSGTNLAINITAVCDATHTWVGQTSGAVWTPTAIPAAYNFAAGAEFRIYSGVQTNVTASFTLSSADWSILAAAFKGHPTSTSVVSGNCGVPNAQVFYSDNNSLGLYGSTTCDGSGNYTLNLFQGINYTIWPSASGYSFVGNQGITSTLTIPTSSTTGFNFAAKTPVYTQIAYDNFATDPNGTISTPPWEPISYSIFDANLDLPVIASNQAQMDSSLYCGAAWPGNWSPSGIYAEMTLGAFSISGGFYDGGVADLYLGLDSNQLPDLDITAEPNQIGTVLSITPFSLGTTQTYYLGAVIPTGSYVAGAETIRVEFFQGKLDTYLNGVCVSSLLNYPAPPMGWYGFDLEGTATVTDATATLCLAGNIGFPSTGSINYGFFGLW